MPVTVSYPGIYMQEAPSSSHTIIAAATNIAVFIGYTHPLKTDASLIGVPQEIFGFADYQRLFGGFVRSAAFASSAGSFGDMASAVNQFFLNGGAHAFVVSVNNQTLKPSAAPSFTVAGLTFKAREVTDDHFAMTVVITPAPPQSPPSDDPLADIKITYGYSYSPPNSPPTSPASPPGTIVGAGAVVEVFRRVSLTTRGMANGVPVNPHHAINALASSSLVEVSGPPTLAPTGTWPTQVSQTFDQFLPSKTTVFAPIDFTTPLQDDTPLDKLPSFNLMVIPGVADNSAAGDPAGLLILSTAMAFCERKLAFLIVDPPFGASADGTNDGIAEALVNSPRSRNAAFYFPYLLTPDPLTGSATNPVTQQPNQIPPAASVAGIYAATDVARGVWKAPAGFQATIKNVSSVTSRGLMTDPRHGTLNPLGINCLRQFPNVPVVVFGARTSAVTFDQQWGYVPVRRMALFLEQTLLANLKWAVFEPNAEPLWSAIGMSINAFMLGLFMQGAFAGAKPSEAFRVQCDGQTTTPDDVDAGIVNIVVSFAPLKPAEFVVVTIAQLAGQGQG